MPSLAGAEWLDTEPLGPSDLRGRVVLVNFWTLTCINWLRQLPHVRAWARAYRDDGLTVLAVHTPEFSFERQPELVRHAREARGIDYPIVLDSDYAIWTAFDNHYWPALYFVDADGTIRDQHFGEDRYQESEGLLQRLLGVDRKLAQVDSLGLEAEADWDHLRTPETYLGYGRGDLYASPPELTPDGRRTYLRPDNLLVNHWALHGQWTIGAESISPDEGGGSITFRFHARDVHLVLDPGRAGHIPFRVQLDGAAPGPSHGLDIDGDGRGALSEGRLYQLVREHDLVRERAVEITFLEPGVKAFVFTFG
jgi:thiol-disulfide isomerase/thioredoxin